MPSSKQPIRIAFAKFMSRRRKRVAMTMCSSDEDESSVASTVSAHRVPLHKTPHSTITTTAKKGVCFNEARNESHANTQMCKEETIDLWYNIEDLSSFKVKNNDRAKEITRSERSIQAVYSYQRVIQRVYDACLKQPVECDDDDVSCLQLSSNDSMYLQKWLNNCDDMDRIGLERKSVRSIAKNTHFRRKDIYKMVLEIQEMETSSSLEDKAGFLRQSCETLSRPSRLFARELAVAQAAAAQYY